MKYYGMPVGNEVEEEEWKISTETHRTDQRIQEQHQQAPNSKLVAFTAWWGCSHISLVEPLRV